MKILYLIVSKKSQPWSEIELAQRDTWVKHISEDDQVLYVYGDGTQGKNISPETEFHETLLTGSPIRPEMSLPSEVREDSLTFASVDGWEEVLTNTLSAMFFALANLKFDWIVRTNVSTFWNPKLMRKKLEKLHCHQIYMGKEYELYTRPEVKYIAGFGLIFSKDVVEKICDNISEFDTRIIDDVQFGQVLQKIGVPMTHLDQRIIHSLRELEAMKVGDLYGGHAFRCKVEEISETNETIRLDSRLFKILEDLLF